MENHLKQEKRPVVTEVEGARDMDALRELAVGYTRVSTPRQGSSGISLEAQRAAIERYAESLGYRVLEIFDEVASGVGEKSFGERSKLRTALDLANQHNAILIVWDWDRLSRHAGFEKQITARFPDRSRVVCAKRAADLESAAKDASLAHAEASAREISKRTVDGMAAKKAEGAVFGNPAILDVQRLGVAAYSNKSRGLDRDLANALREMEDPFGISHAKVADLLNRTGLRTLQGKEWDRSRVRGPLKRARELLRAEESEHYQSLPGFGAF